MTQQPPPNTGLLLRSELHGFLGISKQRVHQLIQEGELPDADATTYGGKELWEAVKLRDWSNHTWNRRKDGNSK